MNIVFAGGGTGGHLIPGLCVARELRRLHPDARVTFLSSGRSIESEVMRHQRFDVVSLGAPKIPRFYLFPVFAVQFAKALTKSYALLRELKPDLVVGLGGYAQVPPLVAAWGMRIPSVLLEVNVIPGRANRLLAPKVREIFVHFKDTVEKFPGAQKITVTGCPVRAEIWDVSREAACAELGFDPARPVVLVIGGSQGAQAVNSAVAELLKATPEKFRDTQWIHLAGPGNAGWLEDLYRSLKISARVYEFCHDMKTVYGASSVAIARAGASTVAELRALSIPSVLIPFPGAKDNHQEWNARVLVSEGIGTLLAEKDLKPTTLQHALEAHWKRQRPSLRYPDVRPEQKIVERIEQTLQPQPA